MTHPKKLPSNEQVQRLVKCVAEWSDLKAIAGKAECIDRARQQLAHFGVCHLEDLGIAPHGMPEGLLEDAEAFRARN